ncbi:TOBE domain-containing protein [Raoultella ornithinolytica]|nr:TOBE domain-containing protein [Raoultella ornithinolytica]
MAVSARNQLTGTVSAVAAGAVNDEVELTLAGGAKLVAIVTHSSKEALGLAAGKEAVALIKAPWVTLATEDCGLKFSARNQFAGASPASLKGRSTRRYTSKPTRASRSSPSSPMKVRKR